MSKDRTQILIVDDDEGDRLQILRCVEQSGLEAECSETDCLETALGIVSPDRFHCILLDHFLPGGNGLDGVLSLLAIDPHLAIIMATGQGNEEVASAAIKRGAMDYFAKATIKPHILRAAIESAVQKAEFARALDEQHRSLALFSRVLVHDMKTPTQSILGFARLAGVFLSIDPIDREKIKGQIQKIADGAVRMNNLLDELHAYTHSDVQPQYENLSLVDIVMDVVSSLDATLQQRQAQVVYDELPRICADRAQMDQLLQNLISNGIKFCEAEVPTVHIEARDLENGMCVVEVRDNGIGIEKKNTTEIFQPFRRLHSQSKFPGTGLGLATCKKIVERHKGEIWCESILGEGTSFCFSVPLVEAQIDVAV